MTIGKKIFITAIIPLIAAVLTLGYLAYQSSVLNQQNKHLKVNILSAYSATDLVHELQKERGLTAGYLGSKGKKFSNELSNQRKLTDTKLTQFSYYLKQNTQQIFPKIANNYATSKRSLSKLIAKRKKIDMNNILLKEALSFYTNINTTLLQNVNVLARKSQDLALSQSLDAYGYFLQAKERAGIERAVVNGILSKDRAINNATFLKWNSLYFGQTFLLNAFESMIDAQTKKITDSTLKGHAIDEVERIRNVIKQKASSGDFGVEASHWFAMSTKRINLFKHISEFQQKAISDIINDVIDTSSSVFLFWLILSISISLFVIIIVVLLLKSINTLLIRTIESIVVATTQLRGTSSEIASASISVADGASAQASSVEEVNATMHETSNNNEKNISGSKQASQLSNSVNSAVEVGYQHIEQLIKSMQDINSSSKEISRIIKTIDAIAFQTNLLALNAAVEAARAGEHGLGFAVVAEEVRNLADRSSKAAKETNDIIAQSITQIEQGNSIADETKNTFEEIRSKIANTTVIVAEISDSIIEQSQGMKEVSLALNSVDEVTQANAANSEEVAASTNELNSQIEIMSNIINELALMIGYKIP
jgi:methyl-accepting chemotaxis protein